jgi:hypothetical protein
MIRCRVSRSAATWSTPTAVASQARYALPIVIGGALLLSACPGRRPTAVPAAATAAPAA